MFCCYCGKMFDRQPSKVKAINFCCRSCLHSYNREKMKFFNQNNNPMNVKGQMSFEARARKRDRMCKGNATGDYTSFMGDFEHRLIAKAKLGRELKPDEVVHHIDGNPHNNKPSNLQVMTRAEHMRHHMKVYWKNKKVGSNETK